VAAGEEDQEGVQEGLQQLQQRQQQKQRGGELEVSKEEKARLRRVGELLCVYIVWVGVGVSCQVVCVFVCIVWVYMQASFQHCSGNN
jgi:hypothetical protein